MIDQALVLYFLSSAVSLYGVILFVWWWIKIRKVSAMYAYITMLFISSFILMGTNFFVRLQKLVGAPCYPDVFELWWWPARLYLYFIVLVVIAIHMSFRAFWIRKRYNTERDNRD